LVVNDAKIAAVIVLGPGAQELARLEDSLDALRCCAPEISPVIVLNDGNDSAAVTAALKKHGCAGRDFPNPRAGQGSFWLGRMTYGLACVYRHLQQEHPNHHVLRLDSDALVVRPFVARLLAQLARREDVGLVGSVGLVCPALGNATWHDWRTRVFRMSKAFSRWDQKPFLKCNLFGAAAAMRALILKAAKNNYAWGYQANGGAYLLTAEAMRRMTSLPEFNHDGLLTNDWMTEDVFYAIAVYAVGLKILEEQNPGDVFGTCWKGLMGHTLDEVWTRGNAVIHSLKDHGPFTEQASRSFFAQHRSRPASAASV
jgi:hypothetical protein